MNTRPKIVISSLDAERLEALLDSSSSKISILAPVGSALLGLSVGDSIEWPKPGGVLRVRV